MRELKEVVLGPQISVIPDSAFYGCILLNTINLDAVTEIETYAFAETDLVNADLTNVSVIGDYAFFNMGSLETVTLNPNGCSIGEGALVEDSVVMPGVVIEAGAIVRHAILGENSKVCKNAVVGGAFAADEAKSISVTSKGAVVEENTVLLPGEML